MLVRNRLIPIGLSTNLRFSQVSLDQRQRDVESLSPKIYLRILPSCPHIKYPSEVEEIEQSLYVDDITSGDEIRDSVCQLKRTVNEIFGQANFKLHKWYSMCWTWKKMTSP